MKVTLILICLSVALSASDDCRHEQLLSGFSAHTILPADNVMGSLEVYHPGDDKYRKDYNVRPILGFRKWLTKLLHTKWIPEQGFINENVQLSDAEGATLSKGSVDVLHMASLRYMCTQGEHEYEVLVNQTNAGYGNLAIKINGIMSGIETPSAILASLRGVVKIPDGIGEDSFRVTPAGEDAVRLSFVIPIDMLPDDQKGKWAYLEVASMEGHIKAGNLFLVLAKMGSDNGGPRVPELDTWFHEDEKDALLYKKLLAAEEKRQAVADMLKAQKGN